MKKLTKILFLCSFSSFVITVLLQYTSKYNQILFILRHSSVYLGIAFLISAIISIFYYIYKSKYIANKINLVSLNIITLVILTSSLVWIADTRLDYIAENDVPYYMNEILYDEYSNKIYESIIVGIEPSIEIIEKTDSLLALHIEEYCECQQTTMYLETVYPDEDLDRYVDSYVQIFVDIIITYNQDTSINTFSYQETRNIKNEPDELEPYFEYVSIKTEVTNEYYTDKLISTKSNYYFSDYMNSTDYQQFDSNIHYPFLQNEATVRYLRLNKILDSSNQESYILEQQVQGEEIDEIAVLYLETTENNESLIRFVESENRLEDGVTWSLESIRSNFIGSYVFSDKYVKYYHSYDEGNVEHGIGLHELTRNYDNNSGLFILQQNQHTSDSYNLYERNIKHYNDLFSTNKYVEIISRGGYFEDIFQIDTSLYINTVKLYEIEEKDFGFLMKYYLDVSSDTPYLLHENSNLMLFVDILPNAEFMELHFYSFPVVFQNPNYPPIVYENNMILNFILAN